MLRIPLLLLLSCIARGATFVAKRGSNLCATAQKLMRDGIRKRMFLKSTMVLRWRRLALGASSSC